MYLPVQSLMKCVKTICLSFFQKKKVLKPNSQYKEELYAILVALRVGPVFQLLFSPLLLSRWRGHRRYPKNWKAKFC